jgi:hypothetical protein
VAGFAPVDATRTGVREAAAVAPGPAIGAAAPFAGGVPAGFATAAADATFGRGVLTAEGFAPAAG